LAPPALGIARAGHRRLSRVGPNEDAGLHRIDVARLQVVQRQIAEAEACLGAGRAYLFVHAFAGASAIREELNFQRYFRDVHIITQHAFVSAQRYETVGAEMLEAQCDRPFFDF
jgi:hypothetical protein